MKTFIKMLRESFRRFGRGVCVDPGDYRCGHCARGVRSRSGHHQFDEQLSELHQCAAEFYGLLILGGRPSGAALFGVFS